MFPLIELSGATAQLRPFHNGDIDSVARSCSDESVQRWLPLPRPYTAEHATDWCLNQAEALRVAGDGIHLAITDGDDCIGCISLKRTDWRSRTTEVGYWVSPWATGRGIASDAVLQLTGWAIREQGFERIELVAAVKNIASQRVAEKSGFVLEGTKRNAGIIHGGRTDLLLYSLVPADLRIFRTGRP